MRYWAIEFYSLIQKFIAIFAAVSAVVAFVLILGSLVVVEQELASRGLSFAEGSIGLAFFSFCGLVGALITALGVYAVAQLLQLLLSIDKNLRGLRWDLRNYQQHPGPVPDLAPVSPQDDHRKRYTIPDPIERQAPEPIDYNASRKRIPAPPGPQLPYEPPTRMDRLMGRDRQLRRMQGNDDN